MKLMDPKSNEFEKCPEGVHVATLYQIVDLGTSATHYDPEPKPRMRFGFETPHEKREDGKPFMITKVMTKYLSQKANLRKYIETLMSKKYTDETITEVNIKDLIGKACQIQVIHSEDGQFANIEEIMPLTKGTETPNLVNEPIYFDLEEPDMAVYEKLSDKTKERIQLSSEWKKEGVPEDDIPF